MGWVLKKDRLPPQDGWYQVIIYREGTKEMGFFKPIPPSQSLDFMQWKTTMKLEQDFADRCVYVKGKAFFDLGDSEQSMNMVTHWYELDPIPELNS